MIILARGNPEEAVLFGCKINGTNITPQLDNFDCQGMHGICGACMVITGS